MMQTATEAHRVIWARKEMVKKPLMKPKSELHMSQRTKPLDEDTNVERYQSPVANTSDQPLSSFFLW